MSNDILCRGSGPRRLDFESSSCSLSSVLDFVGDFVVFSCFNLALLGNGPGDDVGDNSEEGMSAGRELSVVFV